jgi:RimJ/RimL family protein N-acetyltransferase
VTAVLRLEPWTGEGGTPAPSLPYTAAETIAVLTEHPRAAPWGCYLAWSSGDPVGVCAFKAAPDDEGTVEIAYRTLSPHEGRGHATAMIRSLADIAWGAGAAVVIAHTAPTMNASACALARAGFVHADTFVDPDDGLVWYWERVLRDGEGERG